MASFATSSKTELLPWVLKFSTWEQELSTCPRRLALRTKAVTGRDLTAFPCSFCIVAIWSFSSFIMRAAIAVRQGSVKHKLFWLSKSAMDWYWLKSRSLSGNGRTSGYTCSPSPVTVGSRSLSNMSGLRSNSTVVSHFNIGLLSFSWSERSLFSDSTDTDGSVAFPSRRSLLGLLLRELLIVLISSGRSCFGETMHWPVWGGFPVLVWFLPQVYVEKCVLVHPRGLEAEDQASVGS